MSRSCWGARSQSPSHKRSGVWVHINGLDAPRASRTATASLKPTTHSPWRVTKLVTFRVQRVRAVTLYSGHRVHRAAPHRFLLQRRDRHAAKRLVAHGARDRSHPQPRVINTDLAPIYSSAFPTVKQGGDAAHRCRHRPCST